MSECNQLAVHWIETWPMGWSPFPAFTLYGPRGSGKSHLAEVWRGRAQAIVYDRESILATPLYTLLDQHKNIVIDRIDLLIGTRAHEEHLFHLYNSFLQNGLYLLGLSWVAPENMLFQIKDLESRLRAAPHAAILAPDDDVLLKVMARRFHDQGYVVGEGALQFALTRMERSWEALDQLVNAAIQQATASKKHITVPLLREIMLGE